MQISLSTQGKLRYILTNDGEELLKTTSLPELAGFISEEFPEDLACHVQGVEKIVIPDVSGETEQKFNRLLVAEFTKENSFFSETLREDW